MSVLSFFVSFEFYVIYIATFLGLGIWQYVSIFSKYKVARKDSYDFQSQLERLQGLDSISDRFHQLNDWINEQNSKYINNAVKPAWANFYKKYMEYQRKGVTFTPDVYDYFSEDLFVNRYGKRKVAELFPGLFLSVGIIGTFFGIAVGVGGLDPSGDSSVMKDGIGLLLQGMQVKFLSSIAGIILSIIWQCLDKYRHYPSLIESFQSLRQNLDDTFPTEEESIVLFRMLGNQEKHMQDFQVFMSDQLIPQMVSGFSNAVNQSLLPPMEQTQALMGELIQTTSAGQVDSMRQLTTEVMQSLNEITGEQMKNLGEALKATVDWQQRVHEGLTSLVDSMQESAGKQSEMAEKTTLITEKLHSYTESITDYQDVLGQTVGQLNDNTSKNSELQTAVSGLLERMVEERNLFHAYFDEHISRLQSNVESIVTQSETQLSVQTQLEQNLHHMTSMAGSQGQLVEALSGQASLAMRSGEEMGQLVERLDGSGSLLIDIQGSIVQMLDQTGEERKRVDYLVQAIQVNLVEQVELMDVRTQTLSTLWETTSDVMTRMNKQLSSSMGQFTDEMHRGLGRTFEQFDEELTKSVTLLARGVDSIRDGLTDLPDVIQELKLSVKEINKQTQNRLNT